METMATYGWRETRSVADGLFEEGHRFAFLQAVRLLEEIFADRTPPAEGIDPRREVVRFRHAVRLDFPASDVELVRAPREGEPAEMVVNVLGLAGGLGPLPQAVTELIIDRSFRKDTALRDFLDIFNHRLVSLLYRARKKYRPALDSRAPDTGRIAAVVRAFIGLGTPHLADRMDIPDRALLAYAGLLVDSFRSTVGLERIVEDYFGTPVETLPFQGTWQTLDDSDTTRLGVTGRNQRLGESAILGRRIWDAEAGFELRIGPLTFAQFLSFLPNGRAYRALLATVTFYVRAEPGFAFRLVLKKEEVPALRLSAAEGAFLGWTSWLKTRAFAKDDAQVRLRGRR
jgi:type VI secretion system protein ImpH